MMRRFSVWFLILLFVPLISGCGKVREQFNFSDLAELNSRLVDDVRAWVWEVKQPVLARVNGRRINAPDLIKAYNAVPEPRPDWMSKPDGRRRLLEWLIEGEIAAQEARKTGLTRQDDYLKGLIEARRNNLILSYQQRLAKAPVPETDLQTFQDNAAMEQLQNKANRLALKTRPQAEKALKMLKAGKSFAQVAKAVPLDRSQTERLPPEVEKAFMKLKPGEISGIIVTAPGYEIIQRPKVAMSPGVKLNQDRIESVIMSKRWQDKLASLKTSSQVVIASHTLNSLDLAH